MSFSSLWYVAVLSLSLFISSFTRADNPPTKGEFLWTFDKPAGQVEHKSAAVQYDLEPANEHFFIHVPANYDGKVPFGLLVYVSPVNDCTAVPDGWAPVLAEKKLLFIAPQAAGNEQDIRRRRGLAVLGALETAANFRIDPQRIYAAGLSGGARIAGDLGFHQSDLFHGTIQCCGSNFCRPVKQTHAQSAGAPPGKYGLEQATDEEIAAAKKNVRFAVITGEGDFRRGDLLNIYEEGFAKDGYQARLFDIRGMGHENCNGMVLRRALEFVGTVPAPGATQPRARQQYG